MNQEDIDKIFGATADHQALEIERLKKEHICDEAALYKICIERQTEAIAENNPKRYDYWNFIGLGLISRLVLKSEEV